jgi:pullulanase/glycogen debranching enzyme
MNRTSKSTKSALPTPYRASLYDEHKVIVLFSDALDSTPPVEAFEFDTELPIRRVIREGRRRVALIGGPFDMRSSIQLTVAGIHMLPVLPDGILDKFSTNLPLGLIWAENHAIVRLFHPRARSVRLVLFNRPEESPIEELGLTLDELSGCWTLETDRIKPRQYYGFRVEGPDDLEDQSDLVFCDPYSWLVTKSPGWPVRVLSIVPEPLWGHLKNMTHRSIPPRDLMIYEAHVKDVTKLAADVPEQFRGTYSGITKGAFPSYVKDLGFNAIEWLPLHVYDDREPPFGTPVNQWNETARNHWGYMNVQYFAPEPRYCKIPQGSEWSGSDPRIILNVRQMVDSVHEQGLAVIMDVVYNHVGHYGMSPLRHLDPKYWLRHHGDGQLKSDSGCGNDFATERPMARRMIVDSLLHWSRIYGIDGFRFDLAGLIDNATLDAISDTLREDNPKVHLIAEPWGGLYDKRRFAVRGWSCWNDHFRDGIRGHDASKQHGAMLSGNTDEILPQIHGNVVQSGGPFDAEWQSVNYLASHDYYNYGDFLRIALGMVKPDQILSKTKQNEMTPELLTRAKLGFFLLFVSQGMMMIHQGDEWLKSKVVTGYPHSSKLGQVKLRKHNGQLDRDSYNRDDETNWLNWEDSQTGPLEDLVSYVRGFAHVRQQHAALRLARQSNIHPMDKNGNGMLGFALSVPGDKLVVLVNLNEQKEVKVALPQGPWILLATGNNVREDVSHGRAHSGAEIVPPLSARLFVHRDQLKRKK